MTAHLLPRRRLLAIAMAAAGSTIGTASPGLAHRAKSVLTLVRWNAGAGLLEVDHALHAHDGEMALNRIVKVATPDLSQVRDQARLALYTEARFTLTPPDAASLTLRLIGAELAGDDLHVYQDVSLPAPPARLRVRNTILRDVFRTQVNQVNFDMGGGDPSRIRTLTFIGADTDKDVIF
ncbi:DUF6702 family protein [Niveispirillum fermenti]|uniref:DUF6702 family protein n=1 Tax=Niveispirillum fermenti TaxID=1233113 RepID=UPI003A8C81E7